jgi:predicted DNA-binding transcriptional regulator AlpA
MQTFLVSHQYQKTAQSLDNKRLGKQRVEAYQILRALLGHSNGWVNHPATKMWQGHEASLAVYGYTMCEVWKEKGFADSLQNTFDKALQTLNTKERHKPWWAWNDLFVLSHQSNLVRKDPLFYSLLFDVPNNIPYVWPLMDEEAFRLGTYKNGDNLAIMKNGAVYLTSSQVAELLGVSPKTISAYKARGQMPKPDREYGRTPLWRLATIQEWRTTLRTPIRIEGAKE